MGDKNRALRAAARRYMEESGETSLQKAMQHVRREYEQGQDGGEERMGFAEAPLAEEHRPTARVTAYLAAWGAQELLGLDQVQKIVQHGEKHGVLDAGDPITCHLCDKPIVVTHEEAVHIGMTLRKIPRQGAQEPYELQMPVWTHDACGHARVWSWSQLALERRRRNLPVNTADLPAKQHRRGGRTRVEDYYVYTVPENSPPLFYLQPGEEHRHGPLGFRADRLSDGLPAVDLTQGPVPPRDEWSIAADRTGLLHIERMGTGRWYQPPTPWTPPAEWLAAAHYHQRVIFLTAPANSMPTAALEAGTGDLRPLLRVGQQDLLFGARMPIRFA